MFSLEVDRSWLRVRVGRWRFRTYRSYFMKLPSGYREPLSVYAVEMHDEVEGHHVQIGVFTELSDAETLRAQLEAEGKSELYINILPVHLRLKDWEWDR